MESLSTKRYANSFVETFDGDDSGDLSPRQTPGILYSKAVPTPVKEPRLLAWSAELAQEMGINQPESPEDLNVLGGNLLTTSMRPYAACYAGHQFGNWAGQLGDGRAITLGEWEQESGKSWEIQLKGAGPTAYSRRADGRAVLRSSVREYLMSEAMYYLGVPTTRALSLVATGEQVMRDMFYNGNPEYEPGAIVARVAPSFLRFGSFEMPAARKEIGNLQKLTDWAIEKYFPHLKGTDKVLQWFKEVVERTATLIVEWYRVGFVHGVMNTDNMSILGLTIDYGPFSFLDEFDLSFTPNTTDLPGRRYAFGNQASVAHWNLWRLASAIAPLVEETEPLEAILKGYEDFFWDKYHDMMVNKLGLDELRIEDKDLMSRFEKVLSSVKPDMTIFYQLLMEFPLYLKEEQEVVDHFRESFYQEPEQAERESLYKLMNAYAERMKANKLSREASLQRMKESNPRFILRNYLLHQAIEALEKGENWLFLKLQEAIKEPYSNKFDEFFTKRPAWANKKAGCSMLSCSS